MPNYQDAKIYKILNYENDDVYIGSTTEPTLARRLSGHVRNYKMYLKGKGNYVTSFKVIATHNYDIQLIEAYPCNNKMELHAREGYWIKQIECVNRCVAGQTQIEWRKHNRESLAEKHKVYRDTNKVVIAGKAKAYREANKAVLVEKRKDYYKKNKAVLAEKMKINYKNNREEKLVYVKEYVKKNKDKIYANVECICGGLHTHKHTARHARSKKHQTYVNSIQYLEDLHEYVMSIIKKYKQFI
jgi:hypothetical protein